MNLPIGSVNRGQPKSYTTARGLAFVSAIGKEAVPGPVVVGPQGLDGDAQANRRYHGGPHKALCAYCARHYSLWNTRFGLALGPGAFGENLTLCGESDEHEICLGDIYRVGTLRVQVSQPRQPCVNLVRRWGVRALPAALIEAQACGFYLRVLEEGSLAPGAVLELVERPEPAVSVASAITVLYAPVLPEAAETLLAVESLAPESRRLLGRRLRARDKSA